MEWGAREEPRRPGGRSRNRNGASAGAGPGRRTSVAGRGKAANRGRPAGPHSRLRAYRGAPAPPDGR
eukprot:6694636-Pyramimonas_sp.AAC.1